MSCNSTPARTTARAREINELSFNSTINCKPFQARILHVITALTTGGAETMLLQLLSATRPEYSHGVVSLKDEGTIGPRIRKLGVPLYTLRMHSAAASPVRALGIFRIARQFRPHLIQGWMYHGNLMATFAAAGMPYQTPVIWDIQQSINKVTNYGRMTGAVIQIGAWVSKQPASIIYASTTGAEQHKALGFHSKSQLVIPNAIDCQAFQPSETCAREVREELGLSSNAVLIGQIARFHPMKDHAGFLRAAGLVARRYREARFVLIGTGVTMQQTSLRAIIAAEQLQGRVALLGERSDMPRLAAGLDIACSPSAYGEAFSLAIGEAMACAVPCVVTDVGDSAYIVGDTGLAVPPSNPQALAGAIGRLIDGGAARRLEMGLAARRRVEAEFSLLKVTRQYEELYSQHLPKSGNSQDRKGTRD